MPRGTCQVCGCTEDHACRGGCLWANPEQTVCSQCIGWVVLRPAYHTFDGIFPYDVVPVRNLVPQSVWNHHTKSNVYAFWLDLRRLADETLERIALPMAIVNGGTMEELLVSLRDTNKRVPIDAACIEFGFAAESLERAGARAEEIRANVQGKPHPGLELSRRQGGQR